ncbi:SapC family protein [Thalassotalea sp. ND16A]|uniref:SapC family protein n=1 Tax=Thalassotalea sp. ND16A TaxID=1535422 RepID=UPI00051A2ADA|nr:SapC family protein [Thalassotalea sp. ND16A]KGJ92117.1 hypothetical protein ND16A_1753 [Thalassotalea sp. ND16A]
MNIIPLSKHEHREYKVTSNTSFMHKRQFCEVNFSELRHAASNFPIFFIKDEATGQFCSVALFGLSADQNLFSHQDRWRAHYLPNASSEFPLYLLETADNSGKLSVFIDVDSQFVSTEEGQSLFELEGMNSEYLEQTLAQLRHNFEDEVATKEFLLVLLEKNLIKPWQVTLHFKDEKTHNIKGLYTIDELAFEQLSNNDIVELHQKDYLVAISAIIIAKEQMLSLVEIYNEQEDNAIIKINTCYK